MAKKPSKPSKPAASGKGGKAGKPEKPGKASKEQKPSKAAKPAGKSAPEKPIAKPDAKPDAKRNAKADAKPVKKSARPVAGSATSASVGAASDFDEGTSSSAPPPPVERTPKAKGKAAAAKASPAANPSVSRAVAAAAAEMESDNFESSDRTAMLDPRLGSETHEEAAPAGEPQLPLPIPTDLPPRRADGTITLAHSPDPDDAFMFYALAAGKVDTEGRKYEHVLKDIQSLNEDAKKGTFDVSAISFHAYPYVRQNYALLTCGASFGDGYGPKLIAKSPIRPNEVEGLTIAMPGALTTAALIARLWFGRAKIRAANVPFDKVMDVVKAGMVRAGVIIHEGQLTFKEHGLVEVVDFGRWWSEQTEGLPLPLGGNGIRRDIDKEMAEKIALDLKRSIAYALGHREEALAYAMKFGRNLPKDKADTFVGMYVNDLTLDYGERGRQAVLHLYERAHRAGLLAEVPTPEYVG